MPTRQKRNPSTAIPGLAARALAAEAVDRCCPAAPCSRTRSRAGLDGRDLEARDLALARKIAGTAMRRFGSIGIRLDELLARGMPRKSGPLEAILVTAAAQILFLDVADHAAVDLAVRLARADDRAQAFSGLANAVLRRLSREKADRLAALPADADTPGWLPRRWSDSLRAGGGGRDRGGAAP